MSDASRPQGAPFEAEWLRLATMGFVCSAEARIVIAEVKRISCEWVLYYVMITL